MGSALRTFSLQACTITAGGTAVTGFTADDAITFEPSNAAFEAVTGADGDLSMAQKAVTWTVKVSLSQTSKTNDAFSAILNADIIAGTGVLPFGFADPRGTTVFQLTASRIMGFPSTAIGSTIKNREWTFAGVGFGFVGGN
jgi:hypothetical protein